MLILVAKDRIGGMESKEVVQRKRRLGGWGGQTGDGGGVGAFSNNLFTPAAKEPISEHSRS